MGGIFSGRWGNHRRKTRTDECRSFAVAALVGDTPPTAGHVARFEWRSGDGKTVLASVTFAFLAPHRVVLCYRWGAEEKQVTLPFDLVPRPTPNGGTRYLAVCPLVVNDRPCRRRVAQFFLPPGSPYFGCRHCHRLTYRSRQGHDPRVTRLLKSGKLPEMAAQLEGQSVQTLGLILFALTEEQRRFDRALRKFDPKPKPRRRKTP